MNNFQQGDSYAIPFKIKQGGVPVTDTSGYTIAIKIGDVAKLSGEMGEVVYENGQWLYPLTRLNSETFTEHTPVQVGLKNTDGDIIYSPVQYINFYDSLIRWGDWE